MQAITTTKTATALHISGAEAIIRCLLAEGADTIFGYPGGAIMSVYDALYDFREELHHVLTRHEQGAVHMAQGYARASNRVGVCLATSGPGAANLITGIADAQIDSTPIVCITGQVARHLLGTDAFQETDVMGISMPVTKWNFQVTTAEEIPEAIAKAFYLARSGRPGPVLMDITKNAQVEKFDFAYTPCTNVRSYVAKPKIDPEAIASAAAAINEAERPLVIFGQGVTLAAAEEELKQFVEKGNLPAIGTLLGHSALPTDHTHYAGMPGMHGTYAANKLTNECDVLIAIGMRFDDRVTGNLEYYAKQAKVIHLELDPAEIDKNVVADIPVLGDCKESMACIAPLLHPRPRKPWFGKFKELDQMEEEKVRQGELHPTEGALTMGEVIDKMNQVTQGNAVIVTDVGQHQMVAWRYGDFKLDKSHITSGGLGTMGFALPAAIGAKLGAEDRQVIAVIGDGGFQMTLQELGTIMQTKVPVKILILNNEFLGMVRQWQQLFFDKRYSSTEMDNPDFVTIAKGYGIEGQRVTERDKLPEALQTFLSHPDAYLLEVAVGKENNVFPMVPTGASVSDVRLE
ncbi:MAG TPA: biosynthetic-type acetolactate synthase large subunit [Cytophagales bacterium]|nr:biosynthetic-type acetolactate synthase large subunit [Cytophagales bacterium]